MTGMTIAAAQRENRSRFLGGFYGQFVSGVVWLISASLATWSSPRMAITTLVIGGFFIFLITEILVRFAGAEPLSAANPLTMLGMQTAFVLPLSMPLLLPISAYRLTWFFPAMTILLGAHYCPFITLYGMRMFASLSALLVGGGILIAMYLPYEFAFAAWYTAAVLIAFAFIGKFAVQSELTRESVL